MQSHAVLILSFDMLVITIIEQRRHHPHVSHWQSKWVRWMSEERGVDVFVIHSWTKIWACTGVRLGSVVAPTSTHMARIRARQVVCLGIILHSSSLSASAFLSLDLNLSIVIIFGKIARSQDSSTFRNLVLVSLVYAPLIHPH